MATGLAKRRKYNNEGTRSPSTFERTLALEHLESTQPSDQEKAWKRNPVPNIDPDKDSLDFLQIEGDDYFDVENNEPVIRLYGITRDGNSLVAHVTGFFPYFYVQMPDGFTDLHFKELERVLSGKVREGARTSEGQLIIKDIKKTLKESIWGYHNNARSDFLKIEFFNHKYIPTAKRMLEEGIVIAGLGMTTMQTFESNLGYIIRFMIDLQITGVSWITLPPTKYRFCASPETTCQIEVRVSCKHLISHVSVGDWLHIAPLRILSFDIECAGRQGIFPDASVDPVIQIANVVAVYGNTTPIIRNVFTLGSCAPIAGVHILSFEREQSMLLRWSRFVRKLDPDVVIGYNIANFDFPYLIERAAKLEIEDFPFLGRLREGRTDVKDTRFSSRAYGTRDQKAINLDGRVQFDLLQVMQRDYKLRSYSLNAVCSHFLEEEKEDVHYSIISELQSGNSETRRRLAVYCLKDAYLPLRLMDKLMCLVNYIEMARVTGVPFNYLLARGQQIKVVSQLYRKAFEEDLVIPAMKAQGGEEPYEGATVIEPLKGYYDVPIATLDFSSLYPSIMMAHNLCYTTLLHPTTIDELKLVKDKDYIFTPNNDFFVKSSLRKGLLPTILENLLAARKQAKQDLKEEADPFRRAVLDGRQLALKISANSVYGFTGATIGRLPCLQISSSVTAYGREMIEKAKQVVEEHYCVKHGYQHDAQVIYGDTDSIMIKFGPSDLESVMKLGAEAAELVTKHFFKPIKLEFEKVYFPYLLISKKRYAGLYWTQPTKFDRMDAKGIETVRRDNCRLVSTVIGTCLKKILIDRDAEGAQTYAKQIISDLLKNKIDMSQLVITKALSKTDYAGKQAHVELAERMRKRDAGSAPTLGDRVAYVLVRSTKGAAAYERAEDPIYVLEHNLPIDTKYYLDNQLSKPLMRIFEPILGDKAELLLKGDHTRSIQLARPTNKSGLMKFTVRTITCLGCKAPLKNEQESAAAVCKHCRPKLPVLYQQQVTLLNNLESRFARLWTQCQRCQGSLHQDVICTNQDCAIFYMRKKARKDCQDAADALERFNCEW